MDWLNPASTTGWATALVWFAMGILLTHLFWWRRADRLRQRMQQFEEHRARIKRRQREIGIQLDELSEREAIYLKLEENLKCQAEQLQPQVKQIRSWLEEIVRREKALALREASQGESVGGESGK